MDRLPTIQELKESKIDIDPEWIKIAKEKLVDMGKKDPDGILSHRGNIDWNRDLMDKFGLRDDNTISIEAKKARVKKATMTTYNELEREGVIKKIDDNDLPDFPSRKKDGRQWYILSESKINENAAFRINNISKRAAQILRQLVKDGNLSSANWSYPDALAYLEELGYVTIEGDLSKWDGYTTELTDKGRNYIENTYKLTKDEKMAMAVADPTGSSITTIKTSMRRNFEMLVDATHQDTAEVLVELAAQVIQNEVDAGETRSITGGHTMSDPGFDKDGTFVLDKIKSILDGGKNPYVWGQGFTQKTNEATDQTTFDSLQELYDYIKSQFPGINIKWNSMAKNAIVLYDSININLKDNEMNLSGFNGYDLANLAKKYDMEEYHSSLGRSFYQSPRTRQYTTKITLDDLKHILSEVKMGFSKEGQSQADFYRDREPD